MVILASGHAGAATMSPEKHRQWDWVPGKSDLFDGPPPPELIAPFVRWDSNFYLMIAAHGYPPGGSASRPNYFLTFFPLYPLAVRAVHRLGIDLFWSAIAVSNACCLVAAFLVYELGRLRWTETVGV
jgi:hypothetical protein